MLKQLLALVVHNALFNFLKYLEYLRQSLSRDWLFCNPMDHSLPDSYADGFLQARILKWAATPLSRGLLNSGTEPRSPALQADSWLLTPDCLLLPWKICDGLITVWSSVVSDSGQPHGLYSPWTPPAQNTGVGSRSLLQEDLPNPGIEPVLIAETQGKPLVSIIISFIPYWYYLFLFQALSLLSILRKSSHFFFFFAYSKQ